MKKLIYTLIVIVIVGIIAYVVYDIMAVKPSGESQPVVSNSLLAEPLTTEQNMDIETKVKRTQNDLRTIATAVESFYVDYRRYPERLEQLTTPIAYLTATPIDQFNPSQNLIYRSEGQRWIAMSIGPDQHDDSYTISYDPSNGTISTGDIIRTGPNNWLK